MMAGIGRHTTTMRLATRSPMQHVPPFTFVLVLYKVGGGSPGRRTHFCDTMYILKYLISDSLYKIYMAGENDFTADG